MRVIGDVLSRKESEMGEQVKTSARKGIGIIFAAMLMATALVVFSQPAYADELRAEGVGAQNSAGLKAGDIGYSDDGQWRYKVLPGGAAAITGYYGNSSSVSIPARVDGLKVTYIKSLYGTYHYGGTTPLVKKITIPKTVTKIGYYADFTAADWKDYSERTDMKSVYKDTVNVFDEVGREVDKGSYDQFYPSLKSINVAKGNKKFKSVKGVLFNKKGTKLLAYPNAKSGKYKIPKKVKSVAPFAFENATAKKVTTSKKMKKIGAYTFANSEIKAISIKGKVKSIGKGAFNSAGNDNQKFKKITIPSSVKSIGDFAFSGSSISKVSIGNGVKTIGYRAFSSTNLKKVTIPGSVKKIGMFAFAYNPWLSKIKLKDGVKTIGVGAFERTGIKKITIPKSVKKLATSGRYSSKYTDGDNYTTYYKGNPFVTLAKSVDIYSGGSKYVDEHYYLNNTDRIYDKNAKKKGAKASYAIVDKLKAIKVAKGNKKYVAKKGVLFNKKMTTLVAYPMAKAGARYKMPKKVKTVAPGAFAFNLKLKSIALPKKLKTVGDAGFSRTNITSITLPAKVSKAGYAAFNSSWTTQDQLYEEVTGKERERRPLSLVMPSAVASRLHYTTYNVSEYGNYNVNLSVR